MCVSFKGNCQLILLRILLCFGPKRQYYHGPAVGYQAKERAAADI
jgi:hypothetical protein